MFSTRIKDSLCEFNNLLFQMKSKQTHEPRLSNKLITYRQNQINTFQPLVPNCRRRRLYGPASYKRDADAVNGPRKDVFGRL